MSQKPWRKGDFRELKSKKFPRLECPCHLLETCALGDRFGNQSRLISDPCLVPTSVLITASNKELLVTDPNLKQIKFSSHSFISTVRQLKFISESPHKPSRLS